MSEFYAKSRQGRKTAQTFGTLLFYCWLHVESLNDDDFFLNPSIMPASRSFIDLQASRKFPRIIKIFAQSTQTPRFVYRAYLSAVSVHHKGKQTRAS